MRRRITHVRTSSFASPSQRPPSEGRSRPSLPQVPPGCRLWPAQSPCFSGAGSPVLDSLRRRHRSALRPPRPGVLKLPACYQRPPSAKLRLRVTQGYSEKQQRNNSFSRLFFASLTEEGGIPVSSRNSKYSWPCIIFEVVQIWFVSYANVGTACVIQ